jgi:uncharacterized protein
LTNTDWFSAAQALGGGALIGLASWLLLASLGRVAGISSIAASALAPPRSEATADRAWRWAFLIGLVAGGALFTAWLHPAVIAGRPLVLLLAAGLLVGAGTVLGSGCTSGHGVCGLGRRSGRSLVATLTFMAFGFATVYAIYLATGRSMI